MVVDIATTIAHAVNGTRNGFQTLKIIASTRTHDRHYKPISSQATSTTIKHLH